MAFLSEFRKFRSRENWLVFFFNLISLRDLVQKKKKITGELQEAAFQDLSGKNFSGKKFYKSILRGTIFDKANLEGANMFGSFCKGASFVGANLRNADLEVIFLFSNSFCFRSLER